MYRLECSGAEPAGQLPPPWPGVSMFLASHVCWVAPHNVVVRPVPTHLCSTTVADVAVGLKRETEGGEH